MNTAFPFPGKELAIEELKRDLGYHKIPAEEVGPVIELAWKTGENAAAELLESTGGNRDFFEIAENSGLTILCVDRDQVVGGNRYFSEYLSGKKEITLYTGSIALWAEQNGLTQAVSQNIILAHEYFHFLEMNKIGRTSRLYTVYMLKIGRFTFGRTGVPALSEIAAHAFLRACFAENLDGARPNRKIDETPIIRRFYE